jgi:guanylate kinase
MLLPPDFATQESRLRGRGTETEEKILGRLAQTREELKHLDLYDYIVYNETGKSNICMEQILTIVHAEKLSRKRNPDAEKRYFGE